MLTPKIYYGIYCTLSFCDYYYSVDKIKIAIADDHPKFRMAVCQLLHTYDDFRVVLQAINGKDLLQQLKTKTPDIILMDIRMPEMNGVEATDQVKELYPQIKIIALSQYDFESNIVEMYAHGVKSFIGKDDDSEELVKAIRIVHSGGAYMTNHSAEIIQRKLAYLQPLEKLSNLTEFEEYLLKAICKGQSSSEIGKCLCRSPRTIEEHRTKLYKKFGVSCKEDLLREAFKRNIA